MAGKSVDVLHQLRFADLRGGAAYAAAERDADTGRAARKRAEHQFATDRAVEARPN